jgi:hypothetical protein
MKVYVASPWSDRNLAATFAERLEARGVEITHKWWLKEGDYEEITPEFARECAEKDFFGVYDADCLLLINTSLSEGKAVEMGLALAWGVPIVAVGKPSRNLFHHLPQVKWTESAIEACELVKESVL